jgi:cytochrome oxidase Cu insertion factor (SCO1/SenC/PrrC family)
MKKILQAIAMVILSMATFTLNCYITGSVLVDYLELGTLIDCLYFVIISLIFIRYAKEKPQYAYPVFVVPVIIFSLLFIRNNVLTGDKLFYDLDMFVSVVIALVIVCLKGVSLKYRLFIGVFLSIFSAYIITPKMDADLYFENSSKVNIGALPIDKAHIKKDDGNEINKRDVLKTQNIIVFSFVGCKPCRDLKNVLINYSKQDSSLKKRLVFITNGRLSTFEDFKNYEQYAGVNCYYDSAGIMSDKYVPESSFPVLYLIKDNKNAMKYPGIPFGKTNKSILYDIISKK